MQSPTVVLLQRDSSLAEYLTPSLPATFNISYARTLDEVRDALREISSGVVVLDMEMVSLREISQLSSDFSQASIICNHRTPDDRLWVQAINAGAVDCCASSDVVGIARAVHKNAAALNAA